MQFFLDTIQSERSYGQRVRDIEHAVFTPRVLSTSGGMGRETITTFYKRLADLLSNKRKHPNPGLVKMSTLTCRTSRIAWSCACIHQFLIETIQP